ncbi:MAG: N-acetylmuramoyl-L-alanine amidase [Pseudomonadota bacterium]
MRVRADTVQKILLGAALLVALGWNLAEAAEVRGVEVSQGATGTRAEIALDTAADYRLITLATPDRLVVDLPASSLRRGAALPAPAGIVRGVRLGQPEPGVARIVFDLAQPVAALRPHLQPVPNGMRLVIEWPGDFPATASTAPVPPVASPASPSVAAPTPRTEAATPTFETVATSAVVQTPVTAVGQAQPIAQATRPPGATGPAGATGAVAPVTNDPAKLLPPTVPSVQATPPASTGVAAQPAAPAIDAPAAVTLPPPVKSLRDAAGRPLRPLVIAIDAGHGGQDPGAIGLNGSREKNVTLAIARELARQINATPGYRAFLTRDTDVFLPLHQRTRLARQAKADMFVSIHADAAENRAARGSSVYVLSTKGASSQRARWLADKENAADLIGGVKVEPGNTLASVLLDLTQSGNLRASEDAASQVLSGLGHIGPHHKRTVERANFAVLRTSDIPAMLVETAFISNPEEEQRLVDPSHQRAIARAVLDGVNGYFTRQPPPGTLLAARLEAEAATVAAAGAQAGGR